MSKNLKTQAKDLALATLSRFTGRQAMLLPREAGDDTLIFDLRTSYRVDGQLLIVELAELSQGELVVSLIGYSGHFPERLIWKSPTIDYRGPNRLQLNLNTGEAVLNDSRLGVMPAEELKRRFCLRFDLAGTDGKHRSRLTGHYVPMNGRALEQDYFTGDNYVDHEAQSAGENEKVLGLLRRHNAIGTVLEIGCATGVLLEALRASGFQVFGLDISTWAVERANERLGETSAWVCDVERDEFPDAVLSQAPFGTLILWAVLEHFHEPFAVLSKLGALAKPGTRLLINTTNADSLSHYLFGRDWEGYFDWSHHSVDRVSVASLRRELPAMGWHIQQLTTHLIWDCDADPTKATLRDWYGNDARFRQLLHERELGDLITCVAVKG